MDADPKIPFGYKRVPTGEHMRFRDGVWLDGDFVRMKRPPAGWPLVPDGILVIRRCVVEQPELPRVSDGN